MKDMYSFWDRCYMLAASVYNFSKNTDGQWPMAVMSIGDVSPTAHHMGLTESYPYTYDAVQGKYR